MNKQPDYLQRIRPDLELPWWFASAQSPVNADFGQRVVSLPDTAAWQDTQIPGVTLRVLEYLPGARPRMTGQIRLDESCSAARLGDNPDLEVLIQRGELESSMGVYPAGLYMRLPLTGDRHLQRLTLRGEDDTESSSVGGTRPPTTAIGEQLPPSDAVAQEAGGSLTDWQPKALLYLAAGQMLTSDTEQRRIDTRDEARWLPGPTPGTEVLPLHGHGTGNSMLIRWHSAVEIRPRLDPMGEEILVLEGTLHDALGHYPAGSWIRNPVEAWENWGAVPGTLVYYKNGHFLPASDA